MNSRDLTYYVLFGFIVVVAPMLSTDLLLMLDHLFMRIALVAFLFYLVKTDKVLGLFGLLAIAVLYVERNRRKVDRALKKLDEMDAGEGKSKPASVDEGLAPQQTVPVRSFDQPDDEEFDFLPKEEDFNDLNFEPVAPSINYKSTLSSVYPHNGSTSPSSAEELYENMGFGHVKGVATLGNE
jgi:hypothetical protein